MYPQPGYVEINADVLWQSILSTIRNAISAAKLKSSDISCLGISTQRSTFITWDRVTGETFHNLITWKDLRADSMVRKWNDSVTLKVSKKKIPLLLYIYEKQKNQSIIDVIFSLCTVYHIACICLREINAFWPEVY